MEPALSGWTRFVQSATENALTNVAGTSTNVAGTSTNASTNASTNTSISNGNDLLSIDTVNDFTAMLEARFPTPVGNLFSTATATSVPMDIDTHHILNTLNDHDTHDTHDTEHTELVQHKDDTPQHHDTTPQLEDDENKREGTHVQAEVSTEKSDNKENEVLFDEDHGQDHGQESNHDDEKLSKTREEEIREDSSLDGLGSEVEEYVAPKNIKLSKDVVEEIIDNLDGKIHPNEQKLQMKTLLKKLYLDDMLDLEFALKKLFNAAVMSDKYFKFFDKNVQFLLIILKQAVQSRILDMSVENYLDIPCVKLLNYAFKSNKITLLEEDTRPTQLNPKKVSWREHVWEPVHEFSLKVLKDLKDDEESVRISDIQTAIRVRLYTHDNAPRRDEFRSLTTKQNRQEGENYFNVKDETIVLEDYETRKAFSTYDMKLDAHTAELLNYLKQKKRDVDEKYLFSTTSDEIPTADEWEDLCEQDFDRVCGHKLSTRYIRFLFLQNPEIRVNLDNPFHRIQTIVDMGHTLKEHFCLYEDSSRKRKAEDGNEPAASKKR